MLESVACTVRYFRQMKHANVDTDVTVKTYYGKNLFENNAPGIIGRPITQLNKEDLVDEKIWGPDLGKPEISFASEYRPVDGQSSQSCVVGRKVSNTVNFAWKSGKLYRFATGYKLYKDSTSVEVLQWADGYYQNFIYEWAGNDLSGANTLMASGLALALALALLAF